MSEQDKDRLLRMGDRPDKEETREGEMVDTRERWGDRGRENMLVHPHCLLSIGVSNSSNLQRGCENEE
jgi:hypothetical protein